MKHLFLFTLSFLFFHAPSKSQSVSFGDQSDVMVYMDGKSFFNSENGLTIEYGNIYRYNTYGIKITNKYGNVFYYINVNIDTYGSFADLYGMSPDDGTNFGFRLYRGKLVVGRGEPGEQTFYLK
ncbi:MAG: hypothetical protein ACKOYC_04300 [Bacteroidota bacterium]